MCLWPARWAILLKENWFVYSVRALLYVLTWRNSSGCPDSPSKINSLFESFRCLIFLPRINFLAISRARWTSSSGRWKGRKWTQQGQNPPPAGMKCFRNSTVTELKLDWSRFDRPPIWSELVSIKNRFFKGAQVGGGGANLGYFRFSFILSHNCSALDNSATAPPLL